MWAASCLASCCAACACEACRSVVGGISRRSARIAYCGLFALSLVVSWVLREVAAPVMESLPCMPLALPFLLGINHFHKTPDREWFETDAVLRVSLGNFLFFTILAVLMIGIKDQKDPRDRLHHGGWMPKIVCWCIVVNGSLLPASVISLYCTYLCYSGISSEPRDYECNGLHNHSKAVSTGSLTLGLLTTVLSVVYSAVRAGSSTTLISTPSSPRAGSEKPLLPFDKLEEQEDKKKDEAKPVSYSYAFFHLIFSLASMYSAMLLTGWSTSVGESGKLVDVGWSSVWVRIITGWATAALFIWSLIAPLIFPERESRSGPPPPRAAPAPSPCSSLAPHAGFVGTDVSLALRKRCDGVVGLDNFNSYYDPSLKKARKPLLASHGVLVVEGDINDAACSPGSSTLCPSPT
ncbi:hypothetical protein BHE74_00014082 [Ensete ventricosum]|nr:hypothetical protein GW17_00036392 [Ensete ventricosum]RWW77735.1 hypothetical protein BHE74_00014082 [Ensete ventricosum]